MISPTIRIAGVLAFGAALALCDMRGALSTAGLALALNLWPGSGCRTRLLALLHRSRWLLVTVVVLNVVATPGAPAWPGLPGWSPSTAGLALAVHRGAALVAMIGAINLLLCTTTTVELIDGIARLTQPLRPFGIAPQRVGARLAGAIERLGEADRMLRESARSAGWAAALGNSILAIETRAATGR